MSDSDHNSRLASPVPEDAVGDRASSVGRDGSAVPADDPDMDMDDDDELNSDLSEVDEAEFADFDPTTVALEDRPLVDIDEDVARTLKGKKIQRKGVTDGKKPKEGKREKKKRHRDEDEDPHGQHMEGKRVRKSRSDGEQKIRDSGVPKDKRAALEEDDALLTPEERRRKLLDKQMDMALKNPNKRRRKKDEVVRMLLSSLAPILML
jgi:transcription factor SPN1